MKARQFLNVVMRKYGRGSTYSVSRINPHEQLFYLSAKEAQAAASNSNTDMERMSRMPAPKLRLEAYRLDSMRLDFLPFCEPSSGGDSKILCIDAEGRTVLYDTDAGSLLSVPCLNGPKGANPISFSIKDRQPRDPERADVFYVMGRYPGCYDYFNFETLVYCEPSYSRKRWTWHRLPPPPVPVDCSIIKCHALIERNSEPILIVSSAEVAEPSRVGTYCFNTVSQKWFEVGRWALPFVGRAEHIPKFGNLWFGIADSRPYNFCAMDLSSLHKAPSLLYNWEDLNLPKDWVMEDCSMVYLGAGRFCVTKIFEFPVDKGTGMSAVISGLEVVHQHQGEASRLLMVNHKSKLYNFNRNEIQCIL